jgi:glyoxylase-like metal-dependent hydrolase (beta-lactamase superfamily II)
MEDDVALVRADNPSPLTLTGTNTWLVGRDPCWVVDPGPAEHPEHVAAVLAAAEERGGVAGVALTHGHGDHAGAAPAVAAASGAPILAAAWEGATARIGEGDAAGPLLRAIAVPGHATDHLCFALDGGRACLTGDAVLGAGSVFIAPDPGALRGYLDGLERLRARGFARLLPGHGPIVEDADAKLAEYLGHRLERERLLVAALDSGARSIDALLDAAWSDAPPELRLPATVTLFAHVDKLAEEGRLPDGVEERPDWFAQLGRHAH